MAKFVWYDAMTNDIAASEAFYRGTMGWTAKDSGLTDRAYTIFSMGSTPVSGLMPVPPPLHAAAAPPCWSGYIGVDDVDAEAARVTAAGGAIQRPPEDIPGVGRFAVAADPYGAVFLLYKDTNETEYPPVSPGTPGHVGWHELHAGDLDGAFAFYSGLFGWTKAETIEMPGMVYQIFAVDGVPAGGMMTRMPQTPGPFWMYYFNTGSVEAAMARVADGGGHVVHGPMQVPGGNWIAHCTDPDGAIFGFVAPNR